MTFTSATIIEKMKMERPAPREVLRRVLFPFALFSFVLLALLVLSWFLLLPRFTRVDVHGAPQDPLALQRSIEEMDAKMKALEQKRLALILPLSDTTFGVLVKEKIEQPDLLIFIDHLKNVAKTFLPEQPQAVHFAAFRAERDVIVVTGDVRNVGLQSMAVLAQFVEAVRAMPGIGRVDFPPFSRERSEDVGFHSPFTLRIHLS